MKPFLNWAAALASIIGLFFTLKPNFSEFSAWQIVGLTIAILIFIGAALSDLKDTYRLSKKKYPNKKKINNYMHSMLKTAGACEICSRDASWILEDRIMKLLEDKARRGELTFLVHQKTEELKKLETLGAKVIDYGKLGFDPLTRFTIVNANNKNSSYVAIGQQRPNESHIIEELDSSNPTFSIAVDLINSIKAAYDKHN